MGKIIDALEATKAIIEAMDAPPVVVFVRPDDYNLFDLNYLPVVMVSESVNTENTVTRQTLGGGVIIDWEIEMLVFVYRGNVDNDKIASTVEPETRGWVEKIIKELTKKQNLTLSGTVNSTMPDGSFTYQAGHIALGTDIFWGAKIIIPVRQNIT